MEHDRFDPSIGSPFGEPGQRRRLAEDVAHRSALRLTFAYRERRVQLVLIDAIAMIVPPSMDITDRPPGSDFWFELQDAKGTPLYRRVARDPMSPAVEVRTGDAERPLAYLDSGIATGEFTLLVPSLADARAVVLFEWVVPEDAVERGLLPAPSEVGRFPVGRGIDRKTIAEDRIPPRTVSDVLSGYQGLATIHLRASDNTGPVASTHYRLDDGEERSGRTVTVKDPGRHTLRYWSVDRAGNVERPHRVTFSVDRPAKREA